MLKKLMESIRRQSLKIDWFKREVDAYRIEQKKQKHNWDLIVNSGQVRNLKPEKLDPFDTHEIVNDGVLEEWQNGRVVGHRPVTPHFVRLSDSSDWEEQQGR